MQLMSCLILGISAPSARLEEWGTSTVKWDLKEKLPVPSAQSQKESLRVLRAGDKPGRGQIAEGIPLVQDWSLLICRLEVGLMSAGFW